MKRSIVAAILTANALLVVASMALADTFTTASSGVDYAVNDGGFYVSTNPITTANNFSGLTPDGSAFRLTAPANDVGIVLYFDIPIKLGDLQGVSIASTGNASPVVNLWLDTGGDGKFFAFQNASFSTPNPLTSLNGDSYAGGPGSHC